ncbi:MAG: hypothetical protein M3O03_00990 [Pseudomonadota bacterium]|nr:hypothetical protein [Pseudomonadota bacterium]
MRFEPFHKNALVCTIILGLLCITSNIAIAGPNDPLEVKLENLRIVDDLKMVYVGNSQLHLMLDCNAKAAACITPKKNKSYWLVDDSTSWVLPGATQPMTFKFIQDFTVSYGKGKNFGLVSEEKSEKESLGMFFLDPGNDGYERDVVIKDGPIVYGTGLGPEDRQRAWSNFFIQFIAIAQKQDANFDVMLAKRCMPDATFCTQSVEAQLSGIGGIKELRNVSITVATDQKDEKRQLARIVCTSPSPESKVCRDWDTGKLQSTDFENAE